MATWHQTRRGIRPRGAVKRPFDIDEVMRRVRDAVKGFPDAAMFALRDLGYGTLFQQLVACIISIRTTDEVSLPTARINRATKEIPAVDSSPSRPAA